MISSQATVRNKIRHVDFAQREGGDLIVIASHGLTGLSHMLLGSVTESVVRQASCPVLTVKAFGKKLY